MEENKKDNLEEMLKNATEKNEPPKESKNDDKSKVKKVVISTFVGLALIGGIFVSASFLQNNPQDFNANNKNPEWIANGNKDGADEESNAPSENWDFNFPFKLESWAKVPYNKETFWTKENDKKLIIASGKVTSFTSSISWLKPGLDYGRKNAKVYTNDIDKNYLKDGSKNPLYSYALKEDYQKAYIAYTERLLNPVFGEWTIAQSRGVGDYLTKEAPEFENLKDMFTEKWWNANVKEGSDYSKLPVLAEWQPDSWKNLKLTDRDTNREGVFYGRINTSDKAYSKVSIVGSDKEGMPVIKVSTPVEFYANKKDGGKLKKTGTLTLTLQSNEDSVDVKNRVVISSASLKVK